MIRNIINLNTKQVNYLSKDLLSELNYIAFCPNCYTLLQFEESDIIRRKGGKRGITANITCNCDCNIQLNKKYLKKPNKLTEDKLFKNMDRIDKYKKALYDQEYIIRQIEELKNIINLVNDGKAVYEFIDIFSDTDKSYEGEGKTIRFNLSNIPIGRNYSFSPISYTEDKEYFSSDMRIAVFQTMIEEYKKILENIERFKRHILSCDDSEIIHQAEEEE